MTKLKKMIYKSSKISKKYWRSDIQLGIEKNNDYLIFAVQILAAKEANPDADTSRLEREIDMLVYKLYGLTEEEIRVVEGECAITNYECQITNVEELKLACG